VLGGKDILEARDPQDQKDLQVCEPPSEARADLSVLPDRLKVYGCGAPAFDEAVMMELTAIDDRSFRRTKFSDIPSRESF
jgi:hypothetical protein